MGKRRARQKDWPIAQAVVTKLSHEGRGIAKVNDRTTFIRGALPGESVTFKFTNKRHQYAEGEVESVIEASPDRVDPQCAVFGICGGCSLQHLDIAKQIAHKQSVLQEHFQHFGSGVSPQEWLPPLLPKDHFGYRAKARLGVRYVEKKGGVLLGFREANGRFLTDMSCCEVLHPSIGDNIQVMRDWLTTLDAKATIPQIEIAVDDHRTALIIRHLEPLSESDLVKIRNFAANNNYWIYLQPKGPDTVHLFYPNFMSSSGLTGGSPTLSYAHPDHNVDILFQPQDFTQVNSELNRKMVSLGIQLLDIQSDETVLDLFCGLGNFTLPMARYAKSVIGVEGDEPMTIRAAQNAKHNGITNAQFVQANLFEDLENQAFMRGQYDKILLDPPRAGAEALMHQLKKLKPKRIVYVSCNPATLARDAGILVNEYGFRLKQAGVMDMFPHTAHVESIAVFE